MPTRSIELKLILPRSSAGDDVRKVLWTTHVVVNEAVAEMSRVLLLCRNRPYTVIGADGEASIVAVETVRDEALRFARQVQVDNGHPAEGSDDEIINALYDLYRYLVPSVEVDKDNNPLKGDAQASANFASPMMDPASEGMLSIFDKILDPLPAWLDKMEREEAMLIEDQTHVT